MDTRAEIRDFLTSRRARLTPAQAGLPNYGAGKRRVPGLRRSELASLAGLSVEYVTQLERGNLGGASDSVLDALARALQLDEAERTHLHDLARAATASGGPGRRRPSTLRPSLYRVLDALVAPTCVSNQRGDVLAANLLGFALYDGILSPQALPFSMPRFVFLDERAGAFLLDWDALADDTVAALRIEAGRTPNDRQLSDLVGELATRSTAFATRWARHNVRLHRTGTKRLVNPLVGELELTADALELPGEDLALITYTAPAGSAAQEKLDFLARWADTTSPTTAATPLASRADGV